MPPEQQTAENSRPAPVIVTSENREAFMAERLRLDVPTEEKPPEPKEEKKPEAKAEPAKAEEKKDDKKAEKQQGLNERFSKMAEQRKAAEERAEKAEAARAAAEKERDEARAAITPKTEEPKDGPPQRSQYDSDEKYLDALTDYRVQKALAKRDADAAEAQAKRDAEARSERWNKRVAEVKASVTDYEERLASSEVRISREAGQAIMDSDVGPHLILYFADNPEEADRIGKMSVGGMLKALGKIEAKVEAKLEADKKPASKGDEKAQTFEPKAQISKAPAPIEPLKGSGGGVDSKVDSKGEFTGTYAQYRAERKAGRLK